ncbi:MAG: PKD domain-containing protein [Lysobacterales bacterium]
MPDANDYDVYVYDRDSGSNERVSVASDGTQGNSSSHNPSISADGRYVAFWSYANNLVSSDTNGVPDVFVHDRDTGATERVSVASDGTQGNSYSYYPSISADGRYVAFWSYASNLVNSDINGVPDVFVHDRATGLTERVSVAIICTQSNSSSVYPSISADGRYVAFWSIANNLVSSDTNGQYDVFVHDRDTGVTERVSVANDGIQGNWNSYYPSISADGRYVAFWSYASNLVSSDTNGRPDVFVHDRDTGETIRVSTAGDETQANSDSFHGTISPDGTLVAFSSYATNLVPTGIDDYHYQAFLKETGLEPSGVNDPPVASASGPYTVDEGDSLTLDGSGSSDPDGDLLGYQWDFDYDGISFDVDASGVAPTFDAAVLDGPAVISVALRVNDGYGGEDIDETTVSVRNVAPEVGDIVAPADPVPVGTAITASATFTDAGTPDTHTASWNWGDGSTAGTVTQGSGSGSVEDGHTYTLPGVYTIGLTVTDDDHASEGNGEDTATYQYVVVYDPNGSFVTGGGTIDSPPGAWTDAPTLTGVASFGFVSKYKKGASEPTGHTEFQFHAAGLDFKSSDYQWLVVAGARAQFKGTGTIQGMDGTFGFFLTAIDGAVNGGGGSDKFRIKIWDEADDSIAVYDNQMGAADDADPATMLRNGSIVIHGKEK